MAKKRRKRGRGGRFVSTKKRGRRRSRRRNPVHSVNPPKRRRRRRRNPTVLVRRGRRYRRLVTAPKVYTRRTRGRYKGSLRRLNPRRRRRSRRRNPVVLVRRGRKLRSYGKHRRVYVRRTRGRRKGTYRRMNPGRLPGVLGKIATLDTAIQAGTLAVGLVLNQTAPALIARLTGKSALARGWVAPAVGLGANAVVALGLGALGYRRAAFTQAVGGLVGVGVGLIRMAIGAVTGRTRTAAAAASAQSGMGALVSPESMIETQALLSGVGDFVQLSGGIPRADFRGVGDYVEFGSQAAGANALAAQLAPAQVFSPGADEKF